MTGFGLAILYPKSNAIRRFALIIRSVHELFWALLLIQVFGIGPLTGVLASFWQHERGMAQQPRNYSQHGNIDRYFKRACSANAIHVQVLTSCANWEASS